MLLLRKLAVLSFVAATFAGASAFADPSADPTSPALTIYNENFAVVRDTIPLSLTAGVNQVSYTGITSQVEPDSVILRDPAGKRTLSILEQNYRGDTVSQGLLLALNEGKTIDFQVPGVNGGPPTIVEGKIIRSGYSPVQPNYNPYSYGYDPNQPVNTPLIEVDGKLQFGLPGTPLFPSLGDDSILNPTLQWSIYTDKAGPLNAELAYITEGINWNAAYNLVAPETGSKVDITAWVTIDNESGKQFDNAGIKLMAGNVHEVHQQNGLDLIVADNRDNSLLNGPNSMATEKALDEYHLYTLPNPTTLRNHETKQVQFLQASNVDSQEVFIYDGLVIDQQYENWGYYNIRSQSDYGTESKKTVTIERDFVNSKANGLGVPLPAGRVRFYRRDDDGQLEFIGEDDIDHTPKDETVKIVTGEAFDLVGNRTQSNNTIDNNNHEGDESFLITLTNHKTTSADIRVVEHLYRSANWALTASSDPYIKVDSSTINFNVAVPANGQKKVTYTVHYTW